MVGRAAATRPQPGHVPVPPARTTSWPALGRRNTASAGQSWSWPGSGSTCRTAKPPPRRLLRGRAEQLGV